MKWHTDGLRGAKTGIRWDAPEALDKVDPYLVWFDLSNFAGAQSAAADRSKFLIEWSDGTEAGTSCMTPTLSFDQVDALLEMTRAGVIHRFELATPVALGPAAPALPASPSPPPVDQVQHRQTSQQPAIVAFIDYGCAFAHRKFRAKPDVVGDVSTRVMALWDQEGAAPAAAPPPGTAALAWQCPPDFGYGLEVLRDGHAPAGSGLNLNEFIAQFRRPDGSIDEDRCYAWSGYHAATRPSTHGTHLMDIATGYPDPQRAPWPRPPSEPHAADIVFVQLPRWIRRRQVGGLLRAHVLDALLYVMSLARPDSRVVVNLSYGTYCGPHDGNSILEQAIDRLIERHKGRLQVVVAAGNAYDQELHARAAAVRPGKPARFDWHVLPDDPSDSFVEIWLPPDCPPVEVRVVPPHFDGECPWLPAGAAATLRRDGSLLASLVHAREACQAKDRRMVLLAVAPTLAGTARRPAPYGRWAIEVRHQGAADIVVDAWCERDDLGYNGEPWPRQGRFTSNETSQVQGALTLSSLAHGKRTVVVGAYVRNGPVARYSSTGPDPGESGKVPNVLAAAEESPAQPGLAAAAMIGAGTVRLNGTSVAAAGVTRHLLGARRLPAPPRGTPPPAESKDHPDEKRVPRLP